jgi:methanol--5-hydroxybenzimidazolylcobamide Co-methyltransferase
MARLHTFSQSAISDLDDFVFGKSPNPVRLPNGMVIGGGVVYPELNFTLPDMVVTRETLPEVFRQYRQMIDEATTRAVELSVPGLVVEFELLPDLTLQPAWGAEVTAILRDRLAEVEQEHGLKTALRVTPNDLREFDRPQHTRSGKYLDAMRQSFEQCARAGATFLAIESTGGKEVHDDAILTCDLPRSIFALSVLGARDMAFLWDEIVEIADRTGVIPASDTACGFANTAMVLAEQRYIPRVWSALIRVMSVVRSLVAFERGAVGPHKDCGYEGVYIKAITGCPISLEGAEAACAHLSPIGNIAKALPDLWSNESVQNVKLLGGMAPTVSMEQLAYAVRLMNVASSRGPEAARSLRDWFVESDAGFDPQAWILRPDVVLRISREIVAEPTPYQRARRGVRAALAEIRQALSDGSLRPLSKPEQRYLDRLSRDADALPETEEELIAQVVPQLDREKVVLEEYEIHT